MRFSPVVPYRKITPPAPGGAGPSVLAFSMAKAGSTLLYNVLQRLCPAVGLTYFSIEDTLFANNVGSNERPGNIGNVFSSTGYCYGGFRQFPAFPVSILHSSRVVFLVRDPRDMMVSLYFSLLGSHVVPKTEESGGAKEQLLTARSQLAEIGPDRYALDAVRSYMRMFEGYVAQGFHWRPNVVTYRYEDVIFSKREWIADLCEWYGWSPDAAVVESVAQEFDVRVEGERPQEHIRQVTPGNYRKHLSPGTIASVTQALGEYMRIYGYA